jgi:hypothetical protein
MAYGTIKVDNITYTNAGSDTTVTVSGLATGSGFSGLTITGTISGATITGNVGEFTTLTAGVATITSGVFASGTASAPSVSFIGDANTGLYSPGADQVAISTNGTGRLFVDANGKVGIGTSSVGYDLEITGTSNVYTRIKNASNNSILVGVEGAEPVIYGSTAAGGALPIVFKTGSAERLRITSDGKLGVGTSSPDALLTVNGVGAHGLGSAAAPSFAFTGDLNTGIYSPGADQVAISTGGTGRLFINSSGQVAVGNASPAFQRTFHVSSADQIVGVYETTNSECRLAFVDSGTTNNAQLSVGSIGNNLVFRTNNAERLRITSDGNVGIGTASPGAKLHIASGSSGATPSVNADDLFIETNGNTGITIGGSTSSSCSIRFADSASSSAGGIYYDHLTDAFDFATAANNRLRIDSSGRLLVGTSSTVSVAGSSAFIQQHGNKTTCNLALVGYANNAGGPILAFGASRSTTVGTAGTIVSSGDYLGEIRFAGDDGTDINTTGASIHAQVDGTPGTDDMPGRLVFSTTPSGSASPSERLRISQDGVVTIKNGAVAEIDALADGATITPDLAASCNFTVSISGNRTIANPSNITAGQTGSIFIIQGTGSNTLSWGSYWDFPAGTAPTLSTASGAVDRVDYIVRTSTSIHTVFTANYS